MLIQIVIYHSSKHLEKSRPKVGKRNLWKLQNCHHICKLLHFQRPHRKLQNNKRKKNRKKHQQLWQHLMNQLSQRKIQSQYWKKRIRRQLNNLKKQHQNSHRRLKHHLQKHLKQRKQNQLLRQSLKYLKKKLNQSLRHNLKLQLPKLNQKLLQKQNDFMIKTFVEYGSVRSRKFWDGTYRWKEIDYPKWIFFIF